MKFAIRRTSGPYDDEGNLGLPCEDAEDRRTGPYDDEKFTIEIPDLEALIEFSAKHGQIVVSPGSLVLPLPEIEIYDDYRE